MCRNKEAEYGVNLRQKVADVMYHSVKRKWEKEEHMEICTREERKRDWRSEVEVA
jgi:hypothetical protein